MTTKATAKAVTPAAENGKKFNPSLGSAFSNDAFGEGAIVLNITEEGYKTLMETARVGSALLLRYNKVTVKGNKHYFAEVLPPMGEKSAKAKAAASPLG